MHDVFYLLERLGPEHIIYLEIEIFAVLFKGIGYSGQGYYQNFGSLFYL